MKKNIFILISLVFLTAGYSFAENHSVHIEWTYDYQPEGKILAGYRLYKEGAEICANNTPTSNYMDCTFESEEGTFEFTLTSFCDDVSESPHSEPFVFTLSTSSTSELAASFTTAPASLSGIAPFTVSYDGSSSSGAASYRWDFGDGDMSNESRTEHIFAVAGTYASTLTVTDRQGNIKTKSVVVTVSDPSGPEFTASFITDPTSLLGIAPFTVTFDATGSTGDISSYNWNFGDGSSGGGAQTSHTYTTAGSFSAILTVKSSTGSINQKNVTVNVGQAPVAVIATTPVSLSGNAPFTVSFDATGSTGDISSYSWDFGDGSSGDGSQTSHTYTTTGSFSAVLTVTSRNKSISQKNVTVNVGQAPVAVIATTPVSLSGETPFTVSFDATGSTGDISSYSWDFGDGSSGDGAQTSHTYSTAGSFKAVLTITSSNGSTSWKDATVNASLAPVAVIATTPVSLSGNAPFTVSFDATGSTGDISSYSWDFGDGSSGDGAQTSHTYTTTGSFSAVLTVTSSNKSISQKDVTVNVGQAPVAVIATTPVLLSGETPFTVSFDATGSTGDINSYSWDFGDGSSEDGAQVTHTYTTTGSFSAVLTVKSSNGSTSQKDITITTTTSVTEIVNIHVEWAYDPQITDDCLLSGYSLYQEDVKVCTSDTPSDRAMDCSFVSQPGTYNFTLTAYCDDGNESPHSEPFSFTLSESSSSELTASFATNPTSLSGTAPFTVSYDGSSSSGAVSYAWEFGDGDMSNESRAEHIFTAAGTYTSTLTVTDRQNNINTKSVIVNVNESSGSALTASFVTDPISLSGTAPFTVSYDGSSSSGAVSYTWGFGDGDVSSGSQTEHIYLTAGIYTSTLTITDSQGNIHTKSVIVTVAEDPAKNTPPTAVIESSATAGNVPLNVSFAGSGSHDPEGSIIAYLWNFGDGSPTASGSTTSHQYTAEGTYNASLKVTDNQGAIDTVSTSIIVTGPQPENQAPTAKITTSTTQGSLPLTVTFDGNASTDPENGSLAYSWNFGDGAFDQGEIVNHTYNMPGSVTATLTVTDSVGAVDSTSTTIKVLPVFSFEVGEVEIDNNWVRVKITENFVNPIVVTGPPSSNGGQPCVIRLINIDKTGFEIRLQEWDYLNGKHSNETVAYLILEQGSFTLKDGTRVEAGQFDSQDNNFHSVSFATAFATEPVIMTSIASFNEEDAVTGRIKNISLKSFEHKIQEQESFSNGHSNETVNYVAWEASRVTFGNFNAIVDRTARAVKNKWYTIPYDELLPDLPIFLGTMQSQNEADTAAIRYRNKSTSDIQVKIEEETSADSDTRHTTESVGYFLFW